MLPFFVGQIAWVPQMLAIIAFAVLDGPHRGLWSAHHPPDAQLRISASTGARLRFGASSPFVDARARSEALPTRSEATDLVELPFDPSTVSGRSRSSQRVRRSEAYRQKRLVGCRSRVPLRKAALTRQFQSSRHIHRQHYWQRITISASRQNHPILGVNLSAEPCRATV